MMKIRIKDQPYNGRNLPAIEVLETDFSIDMQKLKFNIGGSFIASMADIIVPILTLAIKDPLEGFVRGQLKSTLPDMLNKKIIEDEGYFPIPLDSVGWGTLFMDYAYEDSFRIMESYMQGAFNATVFTEKSKYFVPAWKERDMPFHNNESPAQAQVFISEYFMETAAHAILEIKPISYYFSHTMIPDNPFNIKLNTSVAEALVPFLTHYYGKDIPIDAEIRVIKMWDFKIDPKVNNVNLKVNLEIIGWVNYPNGTVVKAATIEY